MQALFNTLSRLFDGLSDIAKAVMIILIADTLLGYHSGTGHNRRYSGSCTSLGTACMFAPPYLRPGDIC
jgi:hypothetical protein